MATKSKPTSQVQQCLTFETPPPTPEHMKKYRKKHNQIPGIKVIHPGLRDDIIPDKEAPLQTSHDVNEVTRMLSEGHHTELGRYIKDKDEIHYKRHKLEPLGKSMDHGLTLPEYTKESTFAFGVKSERSEAGTKELIEIDRELKVQPTFSRMSQRESINAQKEVIQKRDYQYDWKALGVDPETFVFGRARDVEKEEMESVANALKFSGDEQEKNQPLNPRKTHPMPDDFVYGLEPRNNDENNKDWDVSDCIHSDVEERRNILQRDRPENQVKLASIFGDRQTIPSRLNPNRITSGDLVNPSKYGAIGIHPEEFAKERQIEDILCIYKQAGYPVASESVSKIKEMIATEFNGVCSLNNFNAVIKKL